MALPVLHHAWKSSASRRVRLCLAEKGVQFESVLVNLVAGEHHTPEYLKKNPLGVIPLLVLEDGRALYESGTICEYLDETMGASGGWLLGSRYSIADIAVVPFVKRIDKEIAPDEMTVAKHPRVHDWWQRLQARPAFGTARIGSFYD